MAKKVNYTPEMINTATLMYQDANPSTASEQKEVLEAIAEVIGRSVPSVRTKLSQLKVYVRPKAVREEGKTLVKKSELIAKIEVIAGLAPGEGKSLKTATNAVLEAIIAAYDNMADSIADALTNMEDEVEAENES